VTESPVLLYLVTMVFGALFWRAFARSIPGRRSVVSGTNRAGTKVSLERPQAAI